MHLHRLTSQIKGVIRTLKNSKTFDVKMRRFVFSSCLRLNNSISVIARRSLISLSEISGQGLSSSSLRTSRVDDKAVGSEKMELRLKTIDTY